MIWMILIESQWNLNMGGGEAGDEVVAILIESQWNLNKYLFV